MLKQLASLVLVATLVCTLCGPGAFASAPLTSDGKVNGANDPPASGPAGKTEAQPKRSLKEDVRKLVADAKAGKGLVVFDPQNQPGQSNNLSKRTKIAIVVGAAAVVILIIVFIHAKNHFFDDFRPFS